MRIVRRINGVGYLFRVEPWDWIASMDGEPRPCVVCRASTTQSLKATNEAVCLRCQVGMTQVYLPKDHEVSLAVDQARDYRLGKRNSDGKRKVIRLSEAQRFSLVQAVVLAIGNANGSQIEQVCTEYGYPVRKFWRQFSVASPNEQLVEMAKAGASREDLIDFLNTSRIGVARGQSQGQGQPKPQAKAKLKPTEEDYYYEVAVAEVIHEGRTIDEVAEEFELDQERLTELVTSQTRKETHHE